MARTEDIVKAYDPEWWANTTLAVLLDNMVIGNLIYKDFSNEIANAGDIVNTRKPIPTPVRRREGVEPIITDTLSAINIPIRLNQQIYTSFSITDKLQSLSFKDILTEFIQPQIGTMAEKIDRIILAQCLRFWMNVAGRYGQLAGPTARSTILEARQVMNNNKVPVEGRNFIWNPNSETKVLDTDIFTNASAVGDDGTALREASLGKKLGFYHWMSQGLPYGLPRQTTPSGITSTNNVAAGSTTFAATGTMTAALGFRVGAWIVVDGDDIPHRITNITGVNLTFDPPTLHDIVAGAPIFAMGPAISTSAAINPPGTKGQGYIEVAAGDVAKFPIGMAFTIGNGVTADDEPYSVIDFDVANNRIIVDRPIESSYVTATDLNLFIPGDYNFAFDMWALTLVNRRMVKPYGLADSLYSQVSSNGISMRAIMDYDGSLQQSRITLDTLLGVEVLDYDRGCLVVG